MSKFAGVIAAKREIDDTQHTNQETAQEASRKKARVALPAATEAPRRGRPGGKRTDPEFVQTTAYVRRDTLRAVKIALLTEEPGREYSELIEELLFEWLKSNR